jgi:hypothetical protein
MGSLPARTRLALTTKSQIYTTFDIKVPTRDTPGNVKSSKNVANTYQLTAAETNSSFRASLNKFSSCGATKVVRNQNDERLKGRSARRG